jgi:Cysteine-rich secretory protein family
MRLACTGVALLLTLVAACGSDDEGTSGASSSSSSSTSSSSGGSSGGGTGSLAELCVTTINDLRSQNGLPPLERWSAIESCSDGEAKSDGSTNSPHGAFPRCGESAQNECPGWKGSPETAIVQCLKAMWAQPPGEGHHDTMASTKWKRVACGFYTAPSGGVWSVQNFQ